MEGHFAQCCEHYQLMTFNTEREGHLLKLIRQVVGKRRNNCYSLKQCVKTTARWTYLQVFVSFPETYSRFIGKSHPYFYLILHLKFCHLCLTSKFQCRNISYQLGFCVLFYFICVFHLETSSFFIRVSPFHCYFCVIVV